MVPVIQWFLLMLSFLHFSASLSAPMLCFIHAHFLGSGLICTLLVPFACPLLLFKPIAFAYSYTPDNTFDAALIIVLGCVMPTNISCSDLLQRS